MRNDFETNDGLYICFYKKLIIDKEEQDIDIQDYGSLQDTIQKL